MHTETRTKRGRTDDDENPHVVYLGRETAIGLRKALAMSASRERLLSPGRVFCNRVCRLLVAALSEQCADPIQITARLTTFRAIRERCERIGQREAANAIAEVLFGGDAAQGGE